MEHCCTHFKMLQLLPRSHTLDSPSKNLSNPALYTSLRYNVLNILCQKWPLVVPESCYFLYFCSPAILRGRWLAVSLTTGGSRGEQLSTWSGQTISAKVSRTIPTVWRLDQSDWRQNFQQTCGSYRPPRIQVAYNLIRRLLKKLYVIITLVAFIAKSGM